MNELVHGQWFEDKFLDPVYSERLYHQVKALDPVPTLMLNEFHVVAEGDVTDVSTLRFVDQLKEGRKKEHDDNDDGCDAKNVSWL